jgi:hypothetical protein
MLHFKRSTKRASALAMAAALPLAAATAPAVAEEPTPVDALVNGDVDLNFRYRFESVDQQGFDEDANASTLKSRLTYNSADWRSASLTVEFDHVTAVGSDETYNSTRNGVTDRPVVADPEGADLNQAYFEYDGLFDTRFRGGRQRILLDNQRFFGGVGWRQNEQTYDALTFKNSSLPDTTLYYGFIGNVNRIFGPEEADSGEPAADFNTDVHILNASYKGLPGHTITGYSYWMDVQDADGLSNRTTGAYVKGEVPLELPVTPFYRLEYADQSDHADNPSDFDAEYLHAYGGLKGEIWSAKVGVEELGADDNGGGAFRTPFATLHKFQGFADKFLTTAGGGQDVTDTYVSGNVTFLGATFAAFYHDYEEEDGSDDLGDEINLVAKRSFGEHFGGLIKYADYSSGDQGTGFANDDTEKLWLQLTANF